MRSRQEIKQIAKSAYKGQVGTCALILLVYMLLSAVSSFLSFLVVPVLTVGLQFCCLQVYTGQKTSVGSLFSGFERYGTNLGGMLWMNLLLLLWMIIPIIVYAVGLAFAVSINSVGLIALFALLFFALMIPAFIKSYAYSMTPYILADCREVRATQAVKLSNRITKGHKGKVFVMGLSFIGWALLCTLPVYVGMFFAFTGNAAVTAAFVSIGGLVSVALTMFFLYPYMYTAMAGLYLELKQHAIEQGVASPEEFA